MPPHQKEQAIVSILGTGSNCSYFDGKELHQKYNHSVISLWMIVVVMFFELIRKYYFNKMPKN
jgi:hypothetical protein